MFTNSRFWDQRLASAKQQQQQQQKTKTKKNKAKEAIFPRYLLEDVTSHA